jgi:hypothetical protein
MEPFRLWIVLSVISHSCGVFTRASNRLRGSVSVFDMAFCTHHSEPKEPRNHSPCSLYNVTFRAVRPATTRVPNPNSQRALAPVALHRKSSTSLARPATGSWPAANPRSRPSRRPNQSCLVSASRSRGRRLARRVGGAKSAPRLGANVSRLLWRGVGERACRSRAREALWSSLRARLRAAKPGSKRPKS